MSAEVEIKLEVPPKSRAALEAAVRARPAHRTHLQAVYFDTPDRCLAGAGIALRIRREGRLLVQTLKAMGTDVVTRHEHTVALPAWRTTQLATHPIDIGLHQGSAAAELLSRVLDRAGNPAVPVLLPTYRTDIWRWHRELRSRLGTVELAYDRGFIIAGEQRQVVSELEIEYLRGRPEVVMDVARQWAARHGLWIDTRSKAQRGEMLARAAGGGDAVRTPTIGLSRDESPGHALRQVLQACLVQVLGNSSEIAGGAQDEEHVHQLRVGLRKLRVALRLFAGHDPGFEADWSAALASLFRSLGATRDRDVLMSTILPELTLAGAPLTDLPDSDAAEPPHDDARLLVRSPAFTDLMLRLLQFAMTPAPANASGVELARMLAERLRRWHRQIRRESRSFTGLDDEARHELRKRVKRLRYALEFSGRLFPRKITARQLDALGQLQDGLGRYNDLGLAQAEFARLLDADARAWFALGWLSARRAALEDEIAGALSRWRKLPVAWAKDLRRANGGGR